METPSSGIDKTNIMPTDFAPTTDGGTRPKGREYTPYRGGIVIAGVGGRYPESDSVGEFAENLFNKVDMASCDNRRWEPGYMGTPPYSCKLKTVNKFDADFFSVPHRIAELTDPQARLLLETAYEAIIDAGESLESLAGSKTGVYIGISGSEAEGAWVGKKAHYVTIGVPHNMVPNRISFFFDLKGPSIAYDTACSSSLTAFEAAIRHMSDGIIDAAIIGAVNLTLKPALSQAYKQMSMLGSGPCRAFDAAADGFIRAEACACSYITKASTAKRNYATVVGALTNCDGYASTGLTFPNSLAQEQLMKDVYATYNINPLDIKYFETHGTGTPAGDPVETGSILEATCENRKEPLLIGSTKSNMGHAEVGAGMASLTKVVIACNARSIPPNLHYNSPNPNIKGLVEGRLKVVTEPTPLPAGGLVCLNSFGFTGANAHMTIRPYEKKNAAHPASEKARLFVYGARSEDGINGILETAHKHASNVEFHSLCQQSANNPTGQLPFRGATLLNAKQEFTDIQKCQSKRRETWFIYSGMGNQWVGMGRCLMELDIFRKTIEECHGYLKPFDIDLIDLLMNRDEDCLSEIVPPFVMITAVQLGLTDLLTSMGINPDGIAGHSLGEVGCAYADGCYTRKEAILASYWRGQSVVKVAPPPGQMAAVGLTWEEAKARCPAGVYAACHNAETSVTISGELAATQKFMAELDKEGVFVREVNSNQNAYHTCYVRESAQYMMEQLEKVIVPKPRSKRWVSSSVPEHRLDEPSAKICGPQYNYENMVSPVLFREALQKIPSNAIIIEVAPMGLLQSVIKKTVGPEASCVSLQKRKGTNNVEFFLSALGKCYSQGLDMNPLGIYAPVEYPVSIGTPMLSDMISAQWDHTDDWCVPLPEDFENVASSANDAEFEIDVAEGSDMAYLMDHRVDEKPLFPFCGSLYLAWKTLAQLKGIELDQCPIELTNVQVHQAMFLNTAEPEIVTVKVKESTGEFELYTNGTNLMSSGTMTFPEDDRLAVLDEGKKRTSRLVGQKNADVLTQAEVYRELICRGYEYGPYFQGIKQASVDAKDADIKFDGRWISYLDSILQMFIIARQGEQQMLPIKLDTVIIDPRVHPAAPEEGADPAVTAAHYDQILDTATAGGVMLQGLTTIMTPRKLLHAFPTHTEFGFDPLTAPHNGERTCPPANMEHYANALMELARRGAMLWLSQDKHNILPNAHRLKEAIQFCNNDLSSKYHTRSFEEALAVADSIVEAQNLPRNGFSELQKVAFTEPYSEQFFRHVQPKIHDNRFAFWRDGLFSALETPDIVTMILDLVQENADHSVVNILELGARKVGFYERVYPHYVDFHHHREHKYTAADTYFDQETNDFPVQLLYLNPNKMETLPASKNGSYDLVILKYCMYINEDFDKAIEAYTKLLAPGGFILMEEMTQRFAIFHTLETFVRPDMGGVGAAEGERALGCYYTDQQWKQFFDRHNLELVMERQDGVLNSMYLLRKKFEPSCSPTVLQLNDLDPSWLPELQRSVAELQTSMSDDARLWLVSTENFAGLHGLYTCLRWEDGGDKIRYAQVSNLSSKSSVPDFDPNSDEFQELIRKDLVHNVYRDGRWGSFKCFNITYDDYVKEQPKQSVFADCLTAGDMKSLKWFDSPLSVNKQNTDNMTTCSVYYAGVNARDVLLASGKIRRDELPEEMSHNDSVFGVEFSGRDSSGNRVMGLCAPPALASTVRCPPSSLWSVPESWSLEDAATVPFAYGQAYLALMVTARLRPGQTVYVQAGWSDVGQACIAIALHQGCQVFTSARDKTDTIEIKSTFSNLKQENILCDIDTIKHIRQQTKGKGCDVVLQCLADTNVKCNIKLLAKHGFFLDMTNGHARHRKEFTLHAQQDASFQRIDVDYVIASQGPEFAKIHDLVQAGIKSNVVKPLKRTVFDTSRLVEAFKVAGDEKTSGKTVVKIKDEESNKVTRTASQSIPAMFRTSFSPDKSYITIGGIGGLGLELTDWMITRGARKFVLTSRNGVTTGYQTRKLEYLRKQGAQIEVVAIDLSSEQRANQVVAIASKLGPIGGIFNMGMVLKDGLIANLTLEDFKVALAPKITTTQLLDSISRQTSVRESLDHFVVFSSITGIDGLLGQANYNWGNSFMERLVEKRKSEGLQGLAIQWGAVGDVGFVSLIGNSTLVQGKRTQRINSIKNSFDFCLSQDIATVLCVSVFPEKTQGGEDGDEEMTKAQKVVLEAAKVLGFKDISKVDGDKDFTDLGIDSLMTIELKQLLERYISVTKTNQELQALTLNTLKALIEECS